MIKTQINSDGKDKLNYEWQRIRSYKSNWRSTYL